MNPLLRGIAPSLIRAINAKKRPGDIDLGLGEPTLRPDPAPFEAALERVRREGQPYSPNAGFTELGEAIARYHAPPERGDAANVCVTVGSEEAIYLAIKTAVDPARDEVLVVEPCYLAYPKLCALEGIRHRTVPLSGDREFAPSAAAVLAQVGPDTRLIVLNSPCNPTGRVWPEAELRALADGRRARPGPPVRVLADEVYRELYYTPEPPASIARFYEHAMVAGSLSKSNALTGLRLGWLIADAETTAAAVKVHQLVNTAAATFSQWVAMEVFARPESLSAHRPLYAERRRVLLDAARESRVPLVAPEGAFYAMVRLPPALEGDSLGAAERLLDERRVVTVPGIAFGRSGEGWLRVSWVAEEDALRDGLAAIGAFLAAHG
ncbi:MAG TPA: pyridoxal phosphate-dependent aminotransferase [Longimicrobium sp.]|nr:pyridoxal phosphate-dependent aminotransferase [Longimicrobium sp.]